MTQKGTGCRNGEGTLIGLVLFCLFDKLFMLVVFVTGFWSRVSALASRREGLNGRFVKAGSAFYCLIWPCNLGTGALLGCNPRNKKKKKQGEKSVCGHVAIRVTGSWRKTTFADCQRIALKVWACSSGVRGVAWPAQAPVSAFQLGGQPDRACCRKHFSFFSPFYFIFSLKS